MVTGLTLAGIAGCYLIGLVADWMMRDESRVARLLVGIATSLGVVWQSIYLVSETRRAIAQDEAPLSSWHHWCLIAAWGISIAFLTIHWQRPRVAAGVFILPLVLALVAIASLFPRDDLFPVESAGRIWGVLHGGSLLLGTIVVTIGFAAGVMYILQSRRLKRKRFLARGIRLPSLEWLENVSERALLASSVLLGGGLLAGIILNSIHHIHDRDPLPWTDPVVLSSGLLFCWLLVSCLFNWLYRPARVGRKVAYLTVASFIFLAIALAMTLFGPSSHATVSSRSVTAGAAVPTANGQEVAAATGEVSR